jgi:hypothetical protein
LVLFAIVVKYMADFWNRISERRDKPDVRHHLT